MKQVVQSVGDGKLRVVEVPKPTATPTSTLVATRRSLLSSGTERAVRELASASLLQKAKARPDLVKQVIKKARAEGLRQTAQSVRSRLDEDMPLGYSAAGVAIDVGEAVRGVVPGQRVATASAGHAELQLVPGLLTVPIPDEVSFEEAAFGAVAAIAMQGLRQAELGPGATVCVVGLGLIGQLTTRMAIASGLNVIGIDLRDWTVDLARAEGAHGFVEAGEDTTAAVRALTRDRLADAVLLTAATPSSDPVMNAVARVRDRGRVVVVGDVGLHLARTPFYEKEVDLRFARSYGPGRYDSTYEEMAVDYPIGHVRWTQGRNIEAYLDLVARKRMRVDDLVTHVFGIDDAPNAYETIASDPKALAVQFEFDLKPSAAPERIEIKPRRGAKGLGVGLIGAGNFAKATFLPAMKAAGWDNLVGVTSTGGLSARQLAERHGFGLVVSDTPDLLENPEVDVVFVLSRHDSHATLVVDALKAGKHVFVEKPLALSDVELDGIEQAHALSSGQLWVGFNRRYSDAVSRVREQFSKSAGPLVMTYRVSAGRLPDTHWYKDRRQGGRLLGEACHFVDVMSWIVGAEPVDIHCLGSGVGEGLLQEDLALVVRYADGSLATLTYAQDGAAATPKERLEVLGRGHTAVISNFDALTIDEKSVKIAAGKGHKEGLQAFRAAIMSGGDDRSYQTSLESTRIMIRAAGELMSSTASAEA